MPPQADRSSIASIGSLPAWMLNPLINMISMLPGGGEQLLFADMETRISSLYKADATQKVSGGHGTTAFLSFKDIWDNQGCAAVLNYVDCETTVYDFALANEPGRCHSLRSSTFVPILFTPWDRAELRDSLLLSFGALALSQATGTEVVGLVA